MSEAGVQKGAILLLAIGADEAASVMKHLGPREVQKLGAAMSAMSSVQNEDLEAVLEDFRAETDTSEGFNVDSDAYIRTVLTKALGNDKAAPLLNGILGQRDSPGIESLKWMDGESIAELINHEHPQIVATILVHLDRGHAYEVLQHMPEDVRNEVMLRIATLDGVQPAALTELNEVLTKLLLGNQSGKKKPMGGVRAAAEILNYFSGESETSVMENLKAYDETMAQKITDEMFIFDNILDVEDRGIQIVLREVQSESLIVALKGASQDLREKIFKNMSQRAAEMMREDLDSKGPVRLSEVEVEQKAILQIVRRLAEEGQITLGTKGDDPFV
ncbi:MAG: flagellar motor switch protein FliG [Janthinobacterium lividum]